jgi:hypothetical protein
MMSPDVQEDPYAVSPLLDLDPLAIYPHPFASAPIYVPRLDRIQRCIIPPHLVTHACIGAVRSRGVYEAVVASTSSNAEVIRRPVIPVATGISTKSCSSSSRVIGELKVEPVGAISTAVLVLGMSCPVVALTSVKLLGVNACPSMKYLGEVGHYWRISRIFRPDILLHHRRRLEKNQEKTG